MYVYIGWGWRVSLSYRLFNSLTAMEKSCGAGLNSPESPASGKRSEEVVGGVGWVSGDGPGPALTSGLEDVAQGRLIRSDDPLCCLGDSLQRFLLPRGILHTTPRWSMSGCSPLYTGKSS